MFKEEYSTPKKQTQQNLFTRIIQSEPSTLSKVNDLLVANGIKKATNKIQLYYKLISLYKNKKEQLIPDLVALHPDGKFFEVYYETINNEKIDKLKSEFEKEKQEFEKEKQGYEKKISDLKLDIRFGGVQNNNTAQKFGDDGSVEGKSHKSNNDYLPHLVVFGAICVFSISILALTKNKY